MAPAPPAANAVNFYWDFCGCRVEASRQRNADAASASNFPRFPHPVLTHTFAASPPARPPPQPFHRFTALTTATRRYSSSFKSKNVLTVNCSLLPCAVNKKWLPQRGGPRYEHPRKSAFPQPFPGLQALYFSRKRVEYGLPVSRQRLKLMARTHDRTRNRTR